MQFHPAKILLMAFTILLKILKGHCAQKFTPKLIDKAASESKQTNYSTKFSLQRNIQSSLS